MEQQIKRYNELNLQRQNCHWQLKNLSGFTLWGGWEGVCRDATITTSFWLVNRKTFVNDTLSSRGTENYYLENA